MTKKDEILTALLHIPIATTAQQIAKLFQSNGSPIKRASENLNQLDQLDQQKMVQWQWNQREKLWKLTPKARKILNGLFSDEA